MSLRSRQFDTIVARHLLSHPGDTRYRLAKHLRISYAAGRGAFVRLNAKCSMDPRRLLDWIRRNPLPRREFHFSHPAPAQWLYRPPAPVSLSGEDAAVLDGYNLIPTRHLIYVAPEDLSLVLSDLRASAGALSAREDATITVRVRDEWMLDDSPALVERGQRLLDYAESRNIHIIGRFDGGA